MSGENCHLFDKVEIDRDELKFHGLERLLDSSHLEVDVCRCNECSQQYVHVWWEIVNWKGGEDDMWDFFVPVGEADVAELRRALIPPPEARAGTSPTARIVMVGPVVSFVEARRRIVSLWPRHGYWNEGPEIVFKLGPG